MVAIPLVVVNVATAPALAVLVVACGRVAEHRGERPALVPLVRSSGGSSSS